MQIRKPGAFLMFALACLGLNCSIATTVGAQDLSKMSDRQACRTAKELLHKLRYLHPTQPSPRSFIWPITKVDLTSSGFTLHLKAKEDFDISYKDVVNAALYPHYWGFVNIPTQERKTQILELDVAQLGEGRRRQAPADLVTALNQLINDSHEGHPYTCTENLEDQREELSAFEHKTATWRAMATKPAIPDEVYNDRLLAEGALKSKDLGAATYYYEAGVAADPTWAQGWYNAALLYAEQKDYFDAANCMKHYLILVPDAPDAKAAKDNVILWEAKAQTAKP